ncbi:uncharacterized protein LAESUDRAFT_626159, partial [Laetiporus sulphureus 93-53]
MLLWILHSLSPLQIRSRVQGDLTFRQAILHWLDSCVQGDFSTGRSDDIKARLDARGIESDEQNCRQRLPSTTLPVRPRNVCTREEEDEVYRNVLRDADDVVYESNRHRCRLQTAHSKGCRLTNDASCRARFPRDLRSDTEVDEETGAIFFKKSEPWINTFNPIVSAALRCNTDVTSLLSGTTVRAVIAYITDYITKSPLKTHAIFDTVRTVL